MKRRREYAEDYTGCRMCGADMGLKWVKCESCGGNGCTNCRKERGWFVCAGKHQNLQDYIEYNGALYETQIDVVVEGMCGFCGCGDPESVLRYVLKALNALKVLSAHSQTQKESKERLDAFYKMTSELFSDKGAEYFMWYWLDNMGFTEHGGAVPGWLTEQGKELLTAIENVLQENEEQPENI